MKKIIKFSYITLSISLLVVGCTKNDVAINGAANTTTAGSSVLSLNNRVLAAFIIDESTLPQLPAGTLPATGAFNKFRRLFTYDTVATANKPVAYNVGETVNIIGYMKTDDTAAIKRRIIVRLFRAPASFVTVANPPSVVNVMQRAEDSYRTYAPGAGTNPVADTTFTLPTIAPSTTAPFNVTIAGSESIGGIKYNIYLVKVAFTIPASYSGRLMSVNLNANVTPGSTEQNGNVNWIYAFRVR
ncbi:MAG: hypothetical protein ACKVOM_02295 [Ferruginibacter sp.]